VKLQKLLGGGKTAQLTVQDASAGSTAGSLLQAASDLISANPYVPVTVLDHSVLKVNKADGHADMFNSLALVMEGWLCSALSGPQRSHNGLPMYTTPAVKKQLAPTTVMGACSCHAIIHSCLHFAGCHLAGLPATLLPGRASVKSSTALRRQAAPSQWCTATPTWQHQR